MEQKGSDVWGWTVVLFCYRHVIQGFVIRLYRYSEYVLCATWCDGDVVLWALV